MGGGLRQLLKFRRGVMPGAIGGRTKGEDGKFRFQQKDSPSQRIIRAFGEGAQLAADKLGLSWPSQPEWMKGPLFEWPETPEWMNPFTDWGWPSVPEWMNPFTDWSWPETPEWMNPFTDWSWPKTPEWMNPFTEWQPTFPKAPGWLNDLLNLFGMGGGGQQATATVDSREGGDQRLANIANNQSGGQARQTRVDIRNEPQINLDPSQVARELLPEVERMVNNGLSDLEDELRRAGQNSQLGSSPGRRFS